MVALCGWLTAFDKSETNGLLHRGYSLEGRTVLMDRTVEQLRLPYHLVELRFRSIAK
jgi:hypothetical protein